LAPFLAILFLCAGCTVGPKYQKPVAAAPPAFKEPLPAGWKQAQPSEGVLRGKWWEIYKDPALNALEDQVSVSNQNLKASEAQFRAAKAAVLIARSAFYPTVTTSPTITGTQGQSNANTNTSTTRGFFSLPFAASWEPDFWGRVQHSVTAATNSAQSTAALLENARLLFQSELAMDYFQLHGLDADAQLLDAAVKSYQEYLTLTEVRYQNGIASMGDVAQARTQLETTRATLVDVGVQRAQLEHAIAILMGQPPSELSIPAAAIATLPPPVPIGVPSALLERRPDIASAERQVATANEQIGLAQSAYYPTLTLGGSAGFQTSNFTQWFTWPSRFWSVGPTLAQTLFDAGKRHATVYQTEAAYDVTVASYRQSVLTAFQQVEDNLAALRILEQEAEVEDRAVRAAEESLQISTDQYKGGIVSYLQVITAQTAALADQRSAAAILTRRMVASVGLIEALGGGWDTSKLPTASDVQTLGN